MIYEIRGQKVMLDCDLVDLYRVELKALNQATKRNIERSPVDFMFRLTQNELIAFPAFSYRIKDITHCKICCASE